MVLAGSAAAAGGGTAGVGLAGAGVSSTNKIATDIKTFIDGNDENPATADVNGGVRASSVTLHSMDTSTINADAGALAISAAYGGTAGVAVSIGVSLAENHISNDIDAYVADESVMTTGTLADLTISAEDASTIDATSTAAAVSIGGGGTVGVAVSGAGAAAENIILTKTNAHVDDSDVTTTGDVLASTYPCTALGCQLFGTEYQPTNPLGLIAILNPDPKVSKPREFKIAHFDQPSTTFAPQTFGMLPNFLTVIIFSPQN